MKVETVYRKEKMAAKLYVRCTTKDCPGRAVIDGEVLTVSSDYNHDPLSPSRFRMLEAKSAMKRAAEESAKNIFDTIPKCTFNFIPSRAFSPLGRHVHSTLFRDVYSTLVRAKHFRVQDEMYIRLYSEMYNPPFLFRR